MVVISQLELSGALLCPPPPAPAPVACSPAGLPPLRVLVTKFPNIYGRAEGIHPPTHPSTHPSSKGA